jgi:hypothetical protein
MRVNGTDVLNLAHLKDLVSKPSPDGFVSGCSNSSTLFAVVPSEA